MSHAFSGIKRKAAEYICSASNVKKRENRSIMITAASFLDAQRRRTSARNRPLELSGAFVQ